MRRRGVYGEKKGWIVEFRQPLVRYLPAWIRPTVRRSFSRIAVPVLKRTVLARTSVTSLDGFTLTVPAGVFHPKLFFSSAVLGRAVAGRVTPGSRFADLGCGSGIIGLYAARAGARVTGLDLLPAAVNAAAKNYRDNFPGYSFRCVESDLFDALPPGEVFDCIAWNPPYYPKHALTPPDHAWNGGEGRASLRRCAATASSRLATGGALMIISTSDVNQEEVTGAFPGEIYSRRIVRTAHSWFETFFIYEFSLRDGAPAARAPV